jgi:hypothetical protein
MGSFATPTVLPGRPGDLFPEVLPPLAQLVVVRHDHFSALIAEQLRGLSEAGPGFEQVRADRVAVHVGGT